MNIKNPFLLYLFKFIGAFCLIYYGTQAIIGLAAPGNYYSSFVHTWFNYPAWLRTALLQGSKALLYIFNFEAYVHNAYYLSLAGGRSIRMVYSCLGIGLLSFWTAFVFANRGTFRRKLLWIIGGLALIWLINITRIALFLLATNRVLQMPFNLDNHTFFNIAAYMAIFIMIWLFDRSSRKHFQKLHARP